MARVSARPFDSVWKFTRVTVREDGAVVSYLKGAPEVIISRCALSDRDRESWSEKADAYAREGLRVLAVAHGHGDTEDRLTLLGLVLFWDPPRAEVPAAIRLAQQAGIRIVMITGDHPATALSVAHLIGIPGVRVLTGEDLDEYDATALANALREVNVFARVRPEQKLQLVEMLQAQGEIVAMTGDGVNDAPALKRSDVGIAMGQRGSDVSREVADLVLLDDNFATIVGAVEHGRRIYENIQKFLRFLFSTNASEVLLVACGALFSFMLDLRDGSGGLLLPLTAAQILWINLTTDGLPALALAFDHTPGVMHQPPRAPASPLLDGPARRFVIAVGTMKAMLALGMLWVVPYLGYSTDVARAVAFHFMAIGQLLLTYPARHTWMRPLPNRYLHAAVLSGIVVQLAVAWVPLASDLLGGASIPFELWGLVAVGALTSWGLAEAVTRIVWRPILFSPPRATFSVVLERLEHQAANHHDSRREAGPVPSELRTRCGIRRRHPGFGSEDGLAASDGISAQGPDDLDVTWLPKFTELLRGKAAKGHLRQPRLSHRPHNDFAAGPFGQHPPAERHHLREQTLRPRGARV